MTSDAPEVAEFTETFPSGGRTITVERFEPEGDGPHPPVLLLHGSSGLVWRDDAYRDTARRLAARGFVALLPHYFEATGTRYASPSTHPLHFLTWMQTLGDAVGYAGSLPGGPRVGLVGFSLGAYLALAVAANDDRVAAVVECFGGLPDLLAPSARRLPPVLILHGEADRLVPASEARKLERLLKQHGRPHEMKIYPGQGHGFEGEASADAVRRALAFLERHMKAS